MQRWLLLVLCFSTIAVCQLDAADAADGSSSSVRASGSRLLQVANTVDASFLLGYTGLPWSLNPAALIVRGNIIVEGDASATLDIVQLRTPWERTIERKTGGLCNMKRVSTNVQGGAVGIVHHRLTIDYELLPPVTKGWSTWNMMNDYLLVKEGMWKIFREELVSANVLFDPSGWDVVSLTYANRQLGNVALPDTFVPATDIDTPTTTTATRTATTSVFATQAPAGAGPCQYNCPEVLSVAWDKAENVLAFTFCQDIGLRAGPELQMMTLSGTRATRVAMSSQVALKAPVAEAVNSTLRVNVATFVEQGLRFRASLAIGAVTGRLQNMCVAYRSDEFTVSSGGGAGASGLHGGEAHVQVAGSTEQSVLDEGTIIRGVVIGIAAAVFCCCGCVCIYVAHAAWTCDDEDEDAFSQNNKKMRRQNSLKRFGRTLSLRGRRIGRTLSGRSLSRGASNSATVAPLDGDDGSLAPVAEDPPLVHPHVGVPLHGVGVLRPGGRAAGAAVDQDAWATPKVPEVRR